MKQLTRLTPKAAPPSKNVLSRALGDNWSPFASRAEQMHTAAPKFGKSKIRRVNRKKIDQRSNEAADTLLAGKPYVVTKGFLKPDSPRKVAATAKRLKSLGVNTKGMSYNEAKRAARVVGRKQRLAAQGVDVNNISNKQSKIKEVTKPVEDAAANIQQSASKVSTDAADNVNRVTDNAASMVTPQKVAMRAGAKGAALAGGALAVGGAAKGVDTLMDKRKEKMGMKIKKNSLISAMNAGLEDIEKKAPKLPPNLPRIKMGQYPEGFVNSMRAGKPKSKKLVPISKSDRRTNALAAGTGVAGASAGIAAGKKWGSKAWKDTRWKAHHPRPGDKNYKALNHGEKGKLLNTAGRKAAHRANYLKAVKGQAKALAKNPKVAGLAGLTAVGAGATTISGMKAKSDREDRSGVSIYRVKKSKNIFLRRLTRGKKAATHPMSQTGVVEGEKQRRR